MRGAGDAGDSSTSIISFFSDKKGSFKSWPRTSGENSSRNSVKCCGDKKTGESLSPFLSVMPITGENRAEQFYMCPGHPCQSVAGSTSTNNLLLQPLLQAEELQLEQKSSQRHTLQQKSLSLNCNENGKWRHGTHVLQHSPPTTPRYSLQYTTKNGKAHFPQKEWKILQDLSPEHIVCGLEYKGLMFIEAQKKNETHSSTDSDTTYDYFSCAEHSVCFRKTGPCTSAAKQLMHLL